MDVARAPKTRDFRVDGPQISVQREPGTHAPDSLASARLQEDFTM